MSLLLGIDAGASSTKWSLFGPDGEEVASGRVPAISGHVFTDDLPAESRMVLSDLHGALPEAPGRVVAGITGLRPEAAPVFTSALASVFALPPGQVRVVNDMRLAYAATFAPGEGVLLYAGTGSIAYHITSDGGERRAGGHGYLIDDAGGAFWQGQAALRHALRNHDAGRTDALSALVFEALGTTDWDRIRGHVYGEGRRAVALLAPLVEQAALQGDPSAARIARDAARELVSLADTLSVRVGRLPVAVTGGAVSAVVLQEIAGALGSRLMAAQAPVRGALRLADPVTGPGRL